MKLQIKQKKKIKLIEIGQILRKVRVIKRFKSMSIPIQKIFFNFKIKRKILKI